MSRAAEKCSSHPLAQLLPAERMVYTVAKAQAERGDSVPPNTVTVLLLAIQRMEHELRHAHWGGLECDNENG